jgi:NAD(P)-dependent dehydrogenase (short-subunit alcohol dehydrogenase family)
MMARLGANVALMARTKDDLVVVAKETEAAGGQALVILGDVSQPEDCRRAVTETVEKFGQLDAVVNNAGEIGPIASIADGNPDAWEKNWATNLLGPAMITQRALPHLREQQGRVISVSAGSAVRVFPGWAAYSVSKAALNHFTRVLAEEEPAITAIAFRPGMIDTAMQATIRQDGLVGMPSNLHKRFVRHYDAGELLPADLPACALAILALYAPHEWSGSFVPWDDPEVQSLVRRFGCAPASV